MNRDSALFCDRHSSYTSQAKFNVAIVIEWG
jgi:hypothetical protein